MLLRLVNKKPNVWKHLENVLSLMGASLQKLISELMPSDDFRDNGEKARELNKHRIQNLSRKKTIPDNSTSVISLDRAGRWAFMPLTPGP